MSIPQSTRRTHVEAFRSTGTSPGADSSHTPRPVGSANTLLELDHHGPTRLRVRYEVQGPPHAPAVVVIGGISASRHVAASALRPEPGWWPGVVGPGAALDTRRLRVVGIDYLGGPESEWKPSAPVTTADQARAVVAVLDHLGIARASVVGASYGGMVALVLAAAHAERIGRTAVLCAAHRPHPHATAVRAIQRRIVELGAGSAEAVALARGLAMTTYRTAEEFDRRFTHRPDGPDSSGVARFPVESYVESRGQAFASRFDADAFSVLSTSVDLHHVDPEALAVPTLLVSVDSDVLSPPWLCDELTARASGWVRHVTIESPYGHDAFLKETGVVGGLVAEFLALPSAVAVVR